jgi:hypothetical protein
MVLSLEAAAYQEVGMFSHQEAILSIEYAGLELSVDQIFERGDGYTLDG